MMNAERRRILLIGYGNPGRLDDGLGPALAAAVEKLNIPGLTVESDYQLTLEHAHAVAAHDAVIFADADTEGPEPCSFRGIQPGEGRSFSSHAVEPGDVLALAARLFGARTKGYVLGIRGYEFNEFGERLSDKARANLAAAASFVEETLRNGYKGLAKMSKKAKTTKSDAGVRRSLGEGGKAKPVILCVDDDPDFLDSLQTIIEGNGYAFESASNAEEGLRKYKASKPDLVLVDLMMEEVDSGTHFVKDIKALGPVPPIYLLSSVGDGLHAATDHSSLGLKGVLQKPVSPATLVSTLKANLNK